MSDLLSKLDTFDVHGGYLVSSGSRGEYVRKQDVAEALTNPTDEQRALMGKALWDAGPRRPGDPEWEDLDLGLRRVYEREACAVLAAAVGGDDV